MTISDSERKSRLNSLLKKLAPEGSFERLRESLQCDSGAEMLKGLSVDQGRSKAEESLDVLVQGDTDRLAPDQVEALEAVVHLTLRPAIDIVNDRFDQLPPHWSWLAEAETRARIERNIPSIGRIDLPGKAFSPFAGTGFVVGPNLIMTNRHVAMIFAERGGDAQIRFKRNFTATINFLRESIPRQNETEQILSVDDVVMLHPYWDMALLKVKGLSDRQVPLKLSATHPDDLTSRDIVVIGYPQQDERGNIEEHNRIFSGRYGVKRLLPGEFGAFERTEGLEEVVVALTHDASTLGGNSGSAVIHVATGEVLGLHFAGEYLRTNYAVATNDLSQDKHVIDAGVNFVQPKHPNAEKLSSTRGRSNGDDKIGITSDRLGETRAAGHKDDRTQVTDQDPRESATGTDLGTKLIAFLRSVGKETMAALSPLTNEPELQETIWYIEARFPGEPHPQKGSGVMIRLRNPEGEIQNVLLTCQHVVRNLKTGDYSTEVRCWRHDDGYHPDRFWRASRSGISGSRGTEAFEARTVGAKDWVLLSLEKRPEDASRLPFATGFSKVSSLRRYPLLGFPSGADTMDRNVVKASVSKRFHVARIDAHVGTLRLAGSEKAGGGYSGGPYLKGNGRIVALHRSIRNTNERPVGVDGKSIEAGIWEQGWGVVEIGDKAPRRWAIRIVAAVIAAVIFYFATRAPDLPIYAIEDKELVFKLPSTGCILIHPSTSDDVEAGNEPSIKGDSFIWKTPVFQERPEGNNLRARFISQSVFRYRKKFLGIPLPSGNLIVHVRQHKVFTSCEEFLTALQADNDEERRKRREWYEDKNTRPLISIEFSTQTQPKITLDTVYAEANCGNHRIEFNRITGQSSIIPRQPYLYLPENRKYVFRNVFINYGETGTDERLNPQFNQGLWSIHLMPMK